MVATNLSVWEILETINKFNKNQMGSLLKEAGVTSLMNHDSQLMYLSSYFEAMLKKDKYMHHLIISAKKSITENDKSKKQNSLTQS